MLTIAATLMAAYSYAGVFGFEDVPAAQIPNSTADLQDGAYTGGSYGDFATSSGGVNAKLEYIYKFDDEDYSMFWAGGAVSNKTANTGTDYTNDLESVKGGAASGSNFGVLMLQGGDPYTWAAKRLSGDPVFGDAYCTAPFDGYPNPSSLMVDAPVHFTSIKVSLTSYTNYVIENGNASTGTIHGGSWSETNPYISFLNTDGVYAVRIYGLLDDSGSLTEKYVDKILAQSSGGEFTVHELDWVDVDLSQLYDSDDEVLKGLSFSVITNIGNSMGMTEPSYIAIDDVAFTVVPEPAHIAAAFAVLAIALAVYKRRRAN